MRVVQKFGASCLLSLLLAFAPSAFAQRTVTTGDKPPGSIPEPKDVRTRAKAHTDLASAYFRDGNLIVALEELTLATSIDPTYALAFGTRGVVLYQVKEFESAEKDFRMALSLDEKNPDINNNYGWYLCHTGKEKEAIRYFQQAIRNPLYRTPAVALRNEGECYIKLGELDQAEDSLRKGLRLTPNDPQVLYQLARVSYNRGNYDAAKKQMTDVVRLENLPSDVLWLALLIEKRLGNRAAEENLASQLRRKHPESPEYLQLLKGKYE